MATIAIDVDLTVVSTDREWWKWLCEVDTSMSPKQLKNITTYNLGEHSSLSSDFSMGFWTGNRIYDELEPIRGTEVINKLMSLGIDVIFMSSTTTGHIDSKKAWLDEHFPNNKGLVCTDNKEFVSADVYIDDRFDALRAIDILNVNKGNLSFTTIGYDTQYNQRTTFIPDLVSNDWQLIYQEILDYFCVSEEISISDIDSLKEVEKYISDGDYSDDEIIQLWQDYKNLEEQLHDSREV